MTKEIDKEKEMKIGKLLKRALVDKGLVLTYVAEKTGIPYGTLTHYLNDARPLPESKLRLIILTFDLDPKKFGVNVDNIRHKPNKEAI